jgi:hypothetical protein
MLMGHFVHMFWQWSLHISYLNNGIEVHDTLAKTFKTLIPKKKKHSSRDFYQWIDVHEQRMMKMSNKT